MRALLVVAVLVVVVGCKYGPIYGESCVGGLPPECTSPKTAAYCEMAAWDEYSCPAGCGESGACDWSGAVAGTHCPDSMEGQGFCASSASILLCKANRFELTQCRQDCVTLSGDLAGRVACN